ncbi:hypothetical protein, unlikely [Trypanosoma brucei gambiense DAL972]|uniref:T. brucei spp.-specific protein n=1 Tax=Trypanosoma brucei gambiense (strain MHOM/CI/86/DAL972) TaxID=679716 RepID=D0A6H8_TRYB9|nr:hypothetical protein, unlikely [Trypanosoma brucei gambiense DAL972]CBH17279.1 hypothetical protein, unlikely [Trypanosoma brucei gambiense DAL972]|eukprot:XP_011779543.1 hypothetical protein, unlikely [Trypanosoma brucei gambiense DAL972]
MYISFLKSTPLAPFLCMFRYLGCCVVSVLGERPRCCRNGGKIIFHVAPQPVLRRDLSPGVNMSSTRRNNICFCVPRARRQIRVVGGDEEDSNIIILWSVCMKERFCVGSTLLNYATA